MVTEKFPSTEFRKINIKDFSKIKDYFAYIFHVKFYDIESNYINNIISKSKCVSIYNGKYDNGRIMKADEIEIIITDVDLKLIRKAYSFKKYEIIESYFSLYDYLHKDFINFILDKYENKTKYKNVEGKELNYAIEKNKFNSLYGMTVTSTISDKVIYENFKGWREEELKNNEIIELLNKEKKKSFLSFSTRVLGHSISEDIIY